MSDAAIFIVLFGGLFVLRIIAATVVFYYILPQGDRCPNCDSPTVRVRSGQWHRITPFLRNSWCLHCGWEGMLRPGSPKSRPAHLSVDGAREGQQARSAEPRNQ
jgi:hypothetical protein